MNLLLAAKSGWGKSWMCQRLTERNIPQYDHVLVLDFKDEYRGLVSKEYGPGLCRYWKAGEREVQQFTAAEYQELLEVNEHVVLARRSGMGVEDWREAICARSINAARQLDGSVLVVIDEAHFVAPQSGGVPAAIEGLATTGRGEGASAMWVSQRLAKMEETVLAQCEGRFLGGFGSDADLAKVEGVVEYPDDLHQAGGHGIPTKTAEALGFEAVDARAAGGKYPAVRKFTEGEGDQERTVGSEWIYSDESGDVDLADSREMGMETEHVGAQGHHIDVGV